MTAILWLTYAAFCLLTVALLFRLRVDRLSIIDGAFVGLVFYIAVPLAFILANGSIDDPGILAPAYVPADDVDTTLSIFVGWSALMACQMLWGSGSSRAIAHEPARTDKATPAAIAMLALYAVLQLYTFLEAGFLDDGAHWHSSLAREMEGNTMFIVARNFVNSYRTLIFGSLVVLVERKIWKSQLATMIALAITLVDLSTSFNRVTFVYLFLYVVIVYRRHLFLILPTTAVLIPFVATASTMWPMVRGLATVNGFSIEGFAYGIETAIKYSSQSSAAFIYTMNGVFESSNIVVLNYVVRYVDETIPVLFGSTYLLRSIGTFIPSTIWPDKPEIFAVTLGETINHIDGLALNSTLFGEVIANFPYFWPFVLVATLWLLAAIFRRLEGLFPGSSLMGFFVGFALWRFSMNFAVVSLITIVATGVFLVVIHNLGWFRTRGGRLSRAHD